MNDIDADEEQKLEHDVEIEAGQEQGIIKVAQDKVARLTMNEEEVDAMLKTLKPNGTSNTDEDEAT